jgi:hypothetical protein
MRICTADNTAGRGDLDLTHLPPELEIWPRTRVCHRPSSHVGVGQCRDEASNTAWSFNVVAAATWCPSERWRLLGRYDYRRINGLSRDYSTVRSGLRRRF